MPDLVLARLDQAACRCSHRSSRRPRRRTRMPAGATRFGSAARSSAACKMSAITKRPKMAEASALQNVLGGVDQHDLAVIEHRASCRRRSWDARTCARRSGWRGRHRGGAALACASACTRAPSAQTVVARRKLRAVVAQLGEVRAGTSECGSSSSCRNVWMLAFGNGCIMSCAR